MAKPEIPEGVSADYENAEVRSALAALQATPDYAHLAAFLTALRGGFLVVDVTGTSTKKRGPRVRTIRSREGKLVLPLFTSMDELRRLIPPHQQEELKGAIMPAREALALISSDRFVAAEIDKAGASLVILRKYVSLAAGDDEITPELLEGMR